MIRLVRVIRTMTLWDRTIRFVFFIIDDRLCFFLFNDVVAQDLIISISSISSLSLISLSTSSLLSSKLMPITYKIWILKKMNENAFKCWKILLVVECNSLDEFITSRLTLGCSFKPIQKKTKLNVKRSKICTY